MPMNELVLSKLSSQSQSSDSRQFCLFLKKSVTIYIFCGLSIPGHSLTGCSQILSDWNFGQCDRFCRTINFVLPSQRAAAFGYALLFRLLLKYPACKSSSPLYHQKLVLTSCEMPKDNVEFILTWSLIAEYFLLMALVPLHSSKTTGNYLVWEEFQNTVLPFAASTNYLLLFGPPIKVEFSLSSYSALGSTSMQEHFLLTLYLIAISLSGPSFVFCLGGTATFLLCKNWVEFLWADSVVVGFFYLHSLPAGASPGNHLHSLQSPPTLFCA